MAKRKRPEVDETPAAEWSSEEKLALLEAMNSQCPDADKLSFTARVGKMDWEKIEIEDRSAEECQEVWQTLSTKVRKFRTLGEIMEDVKDVVVNPQKYVNKKDKVKHPDQPVKPLTPYFRFLQDRREKIKAENPDLNNIELTRKISQEWQNLDASKHNKYVKKYKKQWTEYREANFKFLKNHPELNPRQTKPKAPSPVDMYMKEKFDSYKNKHSNLSEREIRKKLRRRYTRMVVNKKIKWIKKAVNAIPEFEKEVKNYQQHHPDFEPPPKKVRLTREEAMLNGDVTVKTKNSKKVTRFPGAPKKPPRSAFQLFSMKLMTSLPGHNMKEKMGQVGQQWQELGPKQSKYLKKLDKLKRRYEQDLQDFKRTLNEEDLREFEESLKPAKRTTTAATTKRKEEQSSASPPVEDLASVGSPAGSS